MFSSAQPIDVQCLCLPCAAPCLDCTQNILVHIRLRVIPIRPLLTVHGKINSECQWSLSHTFYYYLFVSILSMNLLKRLMLLSGCFFLSHLSASSYVRSLVINVQVSIVVRDTRQIVYTLPVALVHYTLHSRKRRPMATNCPM